MLASEDQQERHRIGCGVAFEQASLVALRLLWDPLIQGATCRLVREINPRVLFVISLNYPPSGEQEMHIDD